MGGDRARQASSAPVPTHAKRFAVCTGARHSWCSKFESASASWGETLSSATRRFAVKLLSAVIRNSQGGSQCWGNAILRELDFIESDWESLLWALGGTTAVLRHSTAITARSWVTKQLGRRAEWTPKSVGKKAAGLASGVVISAGVLAFSILGLARLPSVLFPARNFEQLFWLGWLPVLVIPEGVFVIAAFALWRKRRDVARGIVLGGVTLAVHVIVHVTTH